MTLKGGRRIVKSLAFRISFRIQRGFLRGGRAGMSIRNGKGERGEVVTPICVISVQQKENSYGLLGRRKKQPNNAASARGEERVILSFTSPVRKGAVIGNNPRRKKKETRFEDRDLEEGKRERK